MNNKLMRKISVLILSLTMVMSSMNLSFAADAVTDQATQPQTTEEVVNPEEGGTTDGAVVDKGTDSKTEESGELNVEKIDKGETPEPVEPTGAGDSLTIYTYAGTTKDLLTKVTAQFKKKYWYFFLFNRTEQNSKE